MTCGAPAAVLPHPISPAFAFYPAVTDVFPAPPPAAVSLVSCFYTDGACRGAGGASVAVGACAVERGGQQCVYYYRVLRAASSDCGRSTRPAVSVSGTSERCEFVGECELVLPSYRPDVACRTLTNTHIVLHR